MYNRRYKIMETSKDFGVVIIGLAFVVITGLVCVTYYNIKRDEAIKSSVESAIVKGIDPMSVRCAYGANDTVCLTYAARK